MKIKLKSTKAIRALLRDAAVDEALAEDVRSEALTWCEESAVEWDSLKRIVHAVRCRNDVDEPLYRELCKGSSIVMDAPQPRRPQYSPEFSALLDRLRKREEQRLYNVMVADIAGEGLGNDDTTQSGGMSTYRQQISLGLHIIVTMGAFYAFGHVSGAALFPRSTLRYIVGLVLMVLALLLETTLFIIRTTVSPKLVTKVDRESSLRQIGLLKKNE